MTQEENELIFKDLLGRLPYGVVMVTPGGVTYTLNFETLKNLAITINGFAEDKPYIRPMSSMTEEEKDEYDRLVMCNASWVIDDWLNKNMFDYRGLIPMGLALEATKDMYKTECFRRQLQEETRNYKDEERSRAKEEASDFAEWMAEMERDRRDGAGTD